MISFERITQVQKKNNTKWKSKILQHANREIIICDGSKKVKGDFNPSPPGKSKIKLQF